MREVVQVREGFASGQVAVVVVDSPAEQVRKDIDDAPGFGAVLEKDIESRGVFPAQFLQSYMGATERLAMRG